MMSTTAKSTTRRVLSVTLNVSSSYKPQIKFLVKTSDWNSYWKIENIYETYLSRSYNGKSKQFSGKLKVWYRGNNKVEYLIVGDFFHNGTTTTTKTAEGSFGVDDLAEARYSVTVSESTNHYKYFEEHKTIQFKGTGSI